MTHNTSPANSDYLQKPIISHMSPAVLIALGETEAERAVRTLKSLLKDAKDA